MIALTTLLSDPMGLYGMAKAFDDITANTDADALSRSEWLAQIRHREQALSYDRKRSARLRYAELRHMAAGKHIDYRADRRQVHFKLHPLDHLATAVNNPG